MKSKINKLADYREAPFERNVTIPYSEEHVQAQMRHLTRGYKKTEAVERLAKGDVAVLSLSRPWAAGCSTRNSRSSWWAAAWARALRARRRARRCR